MCFIVCVMFFLFIHQVPTQWSGCRCTRTRIPDIVLCIHSRRIIQQSVRGDAFHMTIFLSQCVAYCYSVVPACIQWGDHKIYSCYFISSSSVQRDVGRVPGEWSFSYDPCNENIIEVLLITLCDFYFSPH